MNSLEEKADVVFMDYYLNPSDPSQTGLNILDKIKKIDPKINVVMLSSQDSIEVAVNCLKHDAFDYIVKSEVAFMRAQKTLDLIFIQKRLESELVFAKTAAVVLSVILVLILSGMIFL